MVNFLSIKKMTWGFFSKVSKGYKRAAPGGSPINIKPAVVEAPTAFPAPGGNLGPANGVINNMVGRNGHGIRHIY